jgi:hypothetical protein
MRRFRGLPALFRSAISTGLMLGLCVTPAYAKDKDKDKDKDDDEDEVEVQPELKVNEDDFKENDEDEAEPPPKRIEEDDKEETGGDDLDFSDDEDKTDDIKFTDDDEQTSVQPRQPGEDTAQLYRAAQKKTTDMTPDEETIMWEDYLRKYPKSLFADRINDRMEELSAIMFGERVPGSDRGASAIDAAKRELNFATPLKMAPLDTRSHVSAGFDWGFPNWFSLNVDAEYAFLRELSAHVKVGRDFAGWTVSPGARYALIKSSRTGTLLSGGLDVKLNTSPFFPAFRPVVGFGQRLRVMKGLDLSAELAADLEVRESSDVRWFAGLHGELRPNDIVCVFWEWDWDTKYLNNPDVDPFRFFTTSFGLKFVPKKASNEQGDGRILAGMAASLPYATNYWGFYAGGVDVSGDFYF